MTSTKKFKKIFKELAPQVDSGGKITIKFNEDGLGFWGLVCCDCSLIHEIVFKKNNDGSIDTFWYRDDFTTDLTREVKKLIKKNGK